MCSNLSWTLKLGLNSDNWYSVSSFFNIINVLHSLFKKGPTGSHASASAAGKEARKPSSDDMATEKPAVDSKIDSKLEGVSTQPDDGFDRASVGMGKSESPFFTPTLQHNGYEELSDKTVEGCFLTLEKAVSGLVNTLAKTKTVESIPEKSLRRSSSTLRFHDKEGPWLSKNKLPWLRGLIADTIHGELFQSPTSDSRDDQVEHELEGFERMLMDLHANS